MIETPDEMRRALAGDPDRLLQRGSFSKDSLVLARVSEATYRHSAFLDERAEGWPFAETVLALDVLDGLVIPQRPARFVFHMGHTGSTLVSRLLGAAPDVLPLREPQLLASLALLARLAPQNPDAAAKLAGCFGTVLDHFSRTYRPGQVAAIKPTSICNPLMAAMLARHPENRAIHMGASLGPFVASMCRNHSELTRHYNRFHHLDLQRLLGPAADALQPASPGEAAALVWFVHVSDLAAARAAVPDRLMAVDFDAFVDQPAEAMLRICEFLGLAAVAPEVLASVMGRQAKDAAAVFEPGGRQRQIAGLMERHAGEIAAAGAMLARLEGLGAAIPPIYARD